MIRVLHHHDAAGWWAESPDVEGWSAAGDIYAEVVKLAEEGVPFALGHDAALEHYGPGGRARRGLKGDSLNPEVGGRLRTHRNFSASLWFWRAQVN